MKKPLPLKERLMQRRQVDTATGCWLWQGALSSGYGNMTYDRKQIKAHRAAAIVFLGLEEQNDSRLVLHKCRNRSCFNPEHLYLGDYSDNMRDMVFRDKTHWELQKTRCPKGHEYTAENTYHYDGMRLCKACIKERDKKRYLKLKAKQTIWQQTP